MLQKGGQLHAIRDGFDLIILDEAHESVLGVEMSHIALQTGVYLEVYTPSGFGFTNWHRYWVD